MEDKWLEQIKAGKYIKEKDVKILCESIKELLIEENNVQNVNAPVTIVGDIHGQFYDLLEMFKKGGDLPYTNYLFLGDYVDRGYHSVETIELLLVLKLKYPDNLTLIRGNHETRQISYQYGFYEEVCKKYGNANAWKYFTEIFDYLPIAATIQNKIFCVHGGLSPGISTIEQIRLIDRKVEVPQVGNFCDLLWSDPDNIDTWLSSPRCAGYLFGKKVVEEVSLFYYFIFIFYIIFLLV